MVLHDFVLRRLWLLILVLPLARATKFFDDTVHFDKFLQLLQIIRKVHFPCNNRIQPGLDDLPNALKYPWRFVYQYSTQRLWVICLEALDHEPDRRIVHIRHAKIGHIKNNCCCIDRRSQEHSRRLNRIYCVPFQTCLALLALPMKSHPHKTQRPSLFISPV